MVIFIRRSHMIGASDDILWTAVKTDINPANIFAADSKHDHDHTTDEQKHSHQRTIPLCNQLRMYQFVYNQIDSPTKTEDGADRVAILSGKIENAVKPFEKREISFLRL